MSGAEEYLDGLLHSVEGGSPADTARETEPGDTADGLYAEKEQIQIVIWRSQKYATIRAI